MATGGRQERSNSTREGGSRAATALLWRVCRGARLGPRQLSLPLVLLCPRPFFLTLHSLSRSLPAPIPLIFAVQCLCRQTIRNAD